MSIQSCCVVTVTRVSRVPQPTDRQWSAVPCPWLGEGGGMCAEGAVVTAVASWYYRICITTVLLAYSCSILQLYVMVK